MWKLTSFFVDLFPQLCTFCRTIGKIARTAKSRLHTEKNIINRYLQEQACAIDLIAVDVKTAGEHPLVPLGSVSSSSEANKVVFPELTKGNSKREKIGYSHTRQRTLLPMLGPELCDRNKLNGSVHLCRRTTRRIRIGAWKFSCGDVDDESDSDDENPGSSALTRTCSSWFSIRAGNVPLFMLREAQIIKEQGRVPEAEHEALLAARSQQLLYGMFFGFLELQLHEWLPGDRWFQLGHCVLFRRLEIPGAGQLDLIDTAHSLKWIPGYDRDTEKELRNAPIDYVQLKHVEGMVAVAPHIEWIPDGVPNRAPTAKPTRKMHVMPLHI